MENISNIDLWSKTLLKVYGHLEPIVNSLDKIIVTKGLSCAGTYTISATLRLSQEIIELSERKKNLINLKILIENCLRKLKRQDAQILIAKFIDDMKMKDIAVKLDITLRTSFRRVNGALHGFSAILTQFGYTEEKLLKTVDKEKWIVNMFNNLKNKTDSEEWEE